MTHHSEKDNSFVYGLTWGEQGVWKKKGRGRSKRDYNVLLFQALSMTKCHALGYLFLGPSTLSRTQPTKSFDPGCPQDWCDMANPSPLAKGLSEVLMWSPSVFRETREGCLQIQTCLAPMCCHGEIFLSHPLVPFGNRQELRAGRGHHTLQSALPL